eukprot:13891000-Alexandrium_andersonii.AAC.1
MARADARANEYLARRVQESAEAAAAVSSSTGGSPRRPLGVPARFRPRRSRGCGSSPRVRAPSRL